eukprot:g3531.t1
MPGFAVHKGLIFKKTSQKSSKLMVKNLCLNCSHIFIFRIHKSDPIGFTKVTPSDSQSDPSFIDESSGEMGVGEARSAGLHFA